MSKAISFTQTTKYPITFGTLRPGSLFRIHAEVSRGMKYSKDHTVYRRGYDDEGFVAYDMADKSKACLLMPEDKVWPLRVVRA